MNEALSAADSAALTTDLAIVQRRIRVAQGREPGDLLLTGGQVVNVFTRRVERADVVIVDGWIAGVGPYDWPAGRRSTWRAGSILPGLIDSHMHLESTLLTPAELARLVVPQGTTAMISDSHEIGNVLGVPGIDMLVAGQRGTCRSTCSSWRRRACRPRAGNMPERRCGPDEVARTAGSAARPGPGRGDGHPRRAGWRSDHVLEKIMAALDAAEARAGRPRAGMVGRPLQATPGRRHPLRSRVDHRRRGPPESRRSGCWCRCARARAPRTSTRCCRC